MEKLELRIFRFDKDKDYEAYYKPYVYNNYENFATLYDLLLQVQDDDIYFDFDRDENAYIIVNKQIMPLFTPLKKIAKEHNFYLCIEPLSTKRSLKDLIINKDDFLEKYKHLAQFGTDEDKKLYTQYDHLYYTNEILEFHPEYMGDSLFYLAAQMIEKYPEKKLEILKTIANDEKGIFYHLESTNEILENTIKNLQNEILNLGLFDKKLLDFNLPKMDAFDNEIKELQEIKHDFKNFNIAFYGFKACDALKSKLAAKWIYYENNIKNNGFKLLNLNPELCYKMAANILLDAYDQGADFLVVEEKKDFYLFDTCAKKLMQISGREFEDFYILSRFEFLALIQGIQMPSLKNHTLKVSLI
ncbi:DUF5644 domain-containing protein [Campylobacter sp. VicNov18]|uniref:HdrB C-terminal domain-containing protein n=1 Tax=Campylobacter bilis TaxID=2691918 RepID=UPI00130EAB07|nr:DUF5644 domain-containing protein [Campylobacter bilis]MPV63976.1 hypothetical protein [Campylobacter hepaticus]MBM0637477.1 hypothetical protein [Campylobacter bilis]MCC8278196.1 DUF5644 domain-containing protein [Campylobacter bilis]MCC8299700.1 DUF5644 domain-containing protein [Campylobacter bilis]MCC8301105.1 DUF5644 domain-containing protein [Campylobacter bilis]